MVTISEFGDEARVVGGPAGRGDFQYPDLIKGVLAGIELGVAPNDGQRRRLL